MKTVRDDIDLNRILIESIIKNTIKGVKTDPHRSIRRLVEFGQMYATGTNQQQFFNICSNMLENENSRYYDMLENVAAFSTEGRILSIGMTVGYDGLIRGVRKAKTVEDTFGFKLPWTCIFYADGKPAEEGRLANPDWLIQYVRDRGTHLFFFDAQVYPIEKLFELCETYPDCVFICLLRPEDFTDRNIAGIRSYENMVPSIDLTDVTVDESIRAIFKKLRKNKIIYAAHKRYDDENAEALSRFDWCEPLIDSGMIFLFTIPSSSCSGAAKETVRDGVIKARHSQDYPFIFMDWDADVRFLDQWLKGSDCTVFIDPCGGVHMRPDEEPLFSIQKGIPPELIARFTPKPV